METLPLISGIIVARVSKKKEIVIEDDGIRLFNHLYEACNILRGPVAADEYKTYLFPIMFLKRISDVYDEEYEEAFESSSDEDYAKNELNHKFIIPDGYHWSDIRNVVVDVGDYLQKAMRKIESVNPSLFGIFSDFDEASWTNKDKLTDERLKNLIEHFSKISLGNNSFSADIMGQAYEYLIKKFADTTKDSAGEFYTPRAVVRLIIMLLDPQPGETIYDPACGTGGMLIESMRHINDLNMTYGKLYGQEKNLSTSSIARINLTLHGCSDFHIERGDTLRDPKFKVNDNLMTFDCVVANPPFSLENWGYELWEHDPYGRVVFGMPPVKNGDFAWLQHMVKSMDPHKGRMGVVLPQGVLFKKEYFKLRVKLIESGKLDTVIQLAGNLFYGTSLAPCILILSNSQKSDKIRFVDVSSMFKKGRNQNFLEDEHVEKMYEYATSEESIDEHVALIPVGEIDSETSELNVSKYVKKIFVDDTPPYEEVLSKLKANYVEMQRLESEISEMIKEGGFLNE